MTVGQKLPPAPQVRLVEVSVDRSELDGGQSGFGLEQPTEMLGVIKPQIERNLTHGLV